MKQASLKRLLGDKILIHVARYNSRAMIETVTIRYSRGFEYVSISVGAWTCQFIAFVQAAKIFDNYKSTNQIQINLTIFDNYKSTIQLQIKILGSAKYFLACIAYTEEARRVKRLLSPYILSDCSTETYTEAKEMEQSANMSKPHEYL